MSLIPPSLLTAALGGGLSAAMLAGLALPSAACAATWSVAPNITYCSPFPREFGFLRADGLAEIVGATYDLDQRVETATGWQWRPSGFFPASGSSGYVRSDGITALVFGSTLDGDVRELQVNGNSWAQSDLSLAAGASARRLPASVPAGYVRGDGISAVTYIATDNHIHELARVNGAWRDGDLTAAAGTWGASWQMPYVRADRASAVVYTGADGQVWELALVGGRWKATGIGAQGGESLPGHYPMGYVRADGLSAVVYVSPDGHLHELRYGKFFFGGSGWKDYDLTALTGHLATDTPPWAYVNGYRQSAIVYRDATDGHTHEMVDMAGTWSDTDIAVASGSMLPGSVNGSVAFVDANQRSRIVDCWQGTDADGTTSYSVAVYAH